jgi:UPF0271 protein
MISIDLNCDMGEGFPNDEAITRHISSANIACGYHAGSEEIMHRTIELAVKYNVAVGAHPGFNDRENLGRTEQHLSAEEFYELIIDQLTVFSKVARSLQATVHHVKPHGALYNMSAKDNSIARSIAKAVKDFDERLILFGLSGSPSILEAKALGLKTVSEVFADRTYTKDGSLTPRSQPNALLKDAATSVMQILQMIQTGTVTSVDGLSVPIVAESVCIHGDGEHAVRFAAAINQALRVNNISIQAKQ